MVASTTRTWGGSPAGPGEAPTAKRAAKVADRIIQDVIAGGWPVGRILGSEAELLDRYQVSRAVFREAVRLVEHQQVARTRRGPGGGLVVTEPTAEAVIDAVMLYVYRVRARPDELAEARTVLADIADGLSPGRLDERDPARPNPAVELCTDVLDRVVMLCCSGWQDFGRPANGKRAEAVARRITQRVVDDGLRPGQLVGTEPELIQRAGVSRAVFREAVRLLEHHHVARMRRGPGGGLFVVEPSPAAVTGVAAIYLARRGLRLSDLAEVRTGVEVAIAGLAAARDDVHGTMAIREALRREALSCQDLAPQDEYPDILHDLHVAVAGAAGNRVLELIALVFIRLSLIYQIERLAPVTREEVSAQVLRAHQGIAAAVEAGDRELARHRMRRHLDALGAVMR